jgi:hypothetical protein
MPRSPIRRRNCGTRHLCLTLVRIRPEDLGVGSICSELRGFAVRWNRTDEADKETLPVGRPKLGDTGSRVRDMATRRCRAFLEALQAEQKEAESRNDAAIGKSE